MSGNFHEVYSRQEAPLPSDRSAGLVFVGVALIIAYLWRTNATVLGSSLAVAGALMAVSLLAPGLLRPMNVAWMRLALLLSKVVNPIVMAVLFAVAIIPAGLIMQTKRDPLRRKKSSGASYWLPRTKNDQAAPSSMKNQF